MDKLIEYIDGAIAADISGWAKLCLVVLIRNMDYNTHETYIGTKKIAKKMGVSYDTAKRGLDKLEAAKLIECVGEHLIHQGTAKATKIYRILIQPVESEETTGELLARGVGANSSVGAISPTINREPGGVGGVPVGEGAVVTTATHAHMHNADALSDSKTKTETTDQPHGPLSDDECITLAQIFSVLADEEKPYSLVSYTTLREYRGPLAASRLAILMWWALRVSDYWKPETGKWQVLDMENFLRASRTLDKQFRPPVDGNDKSGWRQHDKLVNLMPTAEAVLQQLQPAPADHECEWGPHPNLHNLLICSQEGCGKVRSAFVWTKQDDLEAEFEEAMDHSWEASVLDCRNFAISDEEDPT